MPLTKDELSGLLESAFPGAQITLEDLAGDDDHWAVTVRSSTFKGKTRIQCHRDVYEALGGAAGTTLHALQIKTESL